MVGPGGDDLSQREGEKQADRVEPRLAVRAYERFGGQRRLLIAAVVGFVAFNAGSTWLFGIAQHCGIVHFASQFSRTSERFAWLVQGCTVPAGVQQILLPDFVVMAGYWLMFNAILIGGWWRFEAPALRRASWVLWLPTVALACDVVEYFLLSALLYKDDQGQFAFRGDAGLVNWLQMAVSSGKWIAVGGMVIAGLMAASVWYARRHDRFPPPDSPSRPLGGLPGEPDVSDHVASGAQRVGICLGGGGVRSAAFGLGALSAMEADHRGLPEPPTTSARHLAAVSGGAWAAAAWTLQKASRPTEIASDAVIGQLRTEAGPARNPRHHYLANGRGGVIGAIAWVLVCAGSNLLLFGLSIYLAAWTLALFVTHCAMDSGQLGTAYCAPAPIPPDYFHIPSIVFAVVGVLWLIASGLSNGRVARTWPIGVVLLALSVFLAAWLVWIPRWFRYIDDVNLVAGVAIAAIAASVLVSVGCGLWQLFGGPSLRPARAWLPPLLLAVLAIGAIAWGLLVMYVVAKAVSVSVATPWGAMTLSASSRLAIAIPAAILVGMVVLLGPNRPTLQGISAKRLRRSFGPVPHDDVEGSGTAPAGSWAWLRTKTEVPELILSCSQQRNGLFGTQLRAETFTISPHAVTHGDVVSCRTADYVHLAKHGLEYVSAWLAITGAGSSATGRARSGGANTLLAVTNAGIGRWLPSVAVLPDDTSKLAAEPRFGHLFKQILGWYGADDRYAFVTDGGQRDGLGLVELLRRRCDVVYCVDASADEEGSFATLRSSLRLASLELGFDWDEAELGDRLGALSSRTASPGPGATTFTLNVAAGPGDEFPRLVTVHYTKLQVFRNMGQELNRLAIADPRFPRYSSLTESLTTAQFDSLVQLGRHAGAGLVERAGDAQRQLTESPAVHF